MRTSWMKALSALLLVLSSSAWAEPDSMGLGSGRDGALTVEAAATVVNVYAEVTGPVASGDRVVPVSTSGGFAPGDLVMVLQPTGLAPLSVSGNPWPVDLRGNPVGRWELARIEDLSSRSIRLTGALLFSYAASVTQLIRVPEYTQLTLRRGASLVAAPWDGHTGGVVAFLARGDIINDGEISASHGGFRGGRFEPGLPSLMGCLGVEDEPAGGGAQKGEGLVSEPHGAALTGAGNVSHGGGGGVCRRSGGGGGGQGGPGGQGGRTASEDGERDVGGLGGAMLEYSLLDHLTFGGGGGSGHGTDWLEPRPDGGRGGGAVFIRGRRLLGKGRISAEGEGGGDSLEDGAGGGGAGGSISLRLAEGMQCGSISARGGDGGSTSRARVGPGGGGGGGRVLLQAAVDLGCPVSSLEVGAGLAGSQPDSEASGGARFGAQPEESSRSFYRGVVTWLPGGFAVAPVPTDSDTGTTFQFLSPPSLPNHAVTNSRDLWFSFSSTPEQATYNCRFGPGDALGGEPYGSCTSPFHVVMPSDATAYPDGEYTLEVSTSADSSYATHWTLDTTPPPVVSISVMPPPLTNQSSASFVFQSEVGATYLCRLDTDSSLAYNPCDSHTTFGTLKEGVRTLWAKARDVAGNESVTPTSYSWTIDLTPPDTTLQPASGTVLVGAAGSTRSNPVEFNVSSNESGVSYECSFDGGAFVACGLPLPLSYAAGTEASTHTLAVRAKDAANNVDPTPASVTWKVDTTGPSVTIAEPKPASPSRETFALFSFSAEAGATFQCKLDSAAYAPCVSPLAITSLGEGMHTFSVQATDAVGNPGTAVSHSWAVDVTPPETTIDSGPSGLTNQDPASFAFSSVSTDVEGFECSLDGAGFTPCSSPTSYSSSDGSSHVLLVRAKDQAGNVDPTPAVRTWTADRTAPTVTFVTHPPSLTNSDKASFLFRASETVSRYECMLDSGSSAECSNPIEFTVGEGMHGLQVRAVDLANNTGAWSTSFAWTVDRTPPSSSFSAKPPNPTSDSTASFSVIPSESGVTLECSLDGASFSVCPSPLTYAGLSNGAHVLRVYAVDQAGNVQTTPTTWNWVVDTDPPTVGFLETPPNPDSSMTARFKFVSNKSAAVFECSLDGVAFADCGSAGSEKTYSLTVAGPHNLQVRAKDIAGNVSPVSIWSWTIDTSLPDTRIVDKPSAVTSVSRADFTFSSATGISFECELDPPATGGVFESCPASVSFTGLAEGPHQLKVRAKNAAGSVDPSPEAYGWLVDVTPPDTSILKMPPLKSVSSSAVFEFSSNEMASFECRLDSPAGAMFSTCSSLSSFTVGDGTHVLEVRARDVAGNVDATPSSYTWQVDTTAPLAPRINSPAADTFVNTQTLVIQGTSEPGATVHVFINDTEVGTTLSDGHGSWTFTPTSSLEDGAYGVRAQAIDEFGNTGRTSEPVPFNVDGTDPDTTITDGPAGLLHTTTVSFHFAASESGVSYECSLLGDDFQPCPGGDSATYSDLAEGSYILRVRARDTAGNEDKTPASWTWTIYLGTDSFARGGGLSCASWGGSAPVLSFLALVLLARRPRRAPPVAAQVKRG